MTNEILKQDMKANKFPLWRVALAIGITEMTLIRWLREPERETRVEKISAAIEQLKGAQKDD